MPTAQDLALFATLATAIVIEAAPFLLLGSVVGAVIEVFVPERVFQRLIPRHRAGQVLVGLFAGMILPTCECGVVPVTRRLLLKGVPPQTAIPYMMAAPVVNPVVMASTLVAFQGDVSMLLARLALVVVPAACLGWVLGGVDPRHVLRGVTPRYQGLPMAPVDAVPPGFGSCLDPLCACCHSGHDHGHDHLPDHNHEASSTRTTWLVALGARWMDLARHAALEFLGMFRFLVLGAVISAAFKTFAPLGVMEAVAGNTLLAVAGMMLPAVLLSVCSEADAFVAASFASFPFAAKVAFLAVGPMVDLKLIPMFLVVFQRRVALAVTLVPVVCVFTLAAVLGLAMRLAGG